MGFLQKLKHKLKFAIEKQGFEKVTSLGDTYVNAQHDQMNYLWITYDSCRFDALCEAKTPVLDSYSKIYPAWTQGTYTYPAHLSFFAGILPLVYEPIPYLNRFHKQLVIMKGAGSISLEAKAKHTAVLPATDGDIVLGFKKKGYYTVGTASTTWFTKKNLTSNFNDFKYQRHLRFEDQANFVVDKLAKNATQKPFFAFMNLIETHSPYMHYGEDREEYSMNARKDIEFPPKENAEEIATKGKKLYQAQVEAAEHIDTVLGKVIDKLPKNTFVLIMADHGECFGEDGMWGHGFHHPKVMQVPMACFMLNGEATVTA